jgi:hypothetical protein
VGLRQTEGYDSSWNSTIYGLVELNPAHEPTTAAALHHDPRRLAFIDLGLELAAAPVLQA